jgi:hypothetical protein
VGEYYSNDGEHSNASLSHLAPLGTRGAIDLMLVDNGRAIFSNALCEFENRAGGLLLIS